MCHQQEGISHIRQHVFRDIITRAHIHHGEVVDRRLVSFFFQKCPDQCIRYFPVIKNPMYIAAVHILLLRSVPPALTCHLITDLYHHLMICSIFIRKNSFPHMDLISIQLCTGHCF